MEKKDLLVGRRLHCLLFQDGFFSDPVLSSHLIRVYAACGRLLEATQVFLQAPMASVFTWSAIISAYAKLGQGEHALALFHEMHQANLLPDKHVILAALKGCLDTLRLDHVKEPVGCEIYLRQTCLQGYYHMERSYDRNEGIKPDKYTIVSMLKACSTIGALEEGKLLYAHFVESGFKSDCFVNNSLVDLFGKCGDLEEARRVFDKLPERSVVTWSAMIAGHSLHGQESEAFDAFLQMQNERKTPDNYIYGSILRACSNVKALNKGKLIHEHIVENESELDVVIGSALVDMYVKCNSLEDARMLFDNLAHRDVVTWSTIISGYAQFGAGQEALVLFQQMLQQRGKPNGVTFMSVLKACSSLGAVYEGCLIYGLVIESRLELEKLTGNALVDMYCKCGSVQDAAAVFSSMLDKDIVTWNALIAGYALQGEYSLASLYFESMQQEGMGPDDITFLSLLSCCNHLGLVEEGRHHFLSMQRVFKIMPTVEHFNCVVDLLGRTGHLKEAGDLVQLVPFEARSPGLLSLLSNSSCHGDPGVGKKCYDSAVILDTSNASSYVQVSNLHYEFGMVEEANKLLETKSGTAYAWKNPGKAFIEVYNKVFDLTVGDQGHSQS
ncbi:hypothetical protein L7F22_046550 [Adiantum nelumboides]|nr:hypothetical protein [Adiantum nelumboides]